MDAVAVLGDLRSQVASLAIAAANMLVGETLGGSVAGKLEGLRQSLRKVRQLGKGFGTITKTLFYFFTLQSFAQRRSTTAVFCR